MKKTRSTESQMMRFIQEQEGGRNIHELCRELGISIATFHKGRQCYSGRTQKNERIGGRESEFSLVHHFFRMQ